MSDYTETEEQGWFDRIQESIKGVLVGGGLFLFAFPLLFTNEGCAVKTARSLEQGASAVISVVSDKVDPANDSKLVHMTGNAVTSDKLADPVFGMSQPAIKLSRHVEMYQWVEEKKTKTEKKAGGKKVKTTSYTYKRAWKDSLQESDGFKKKKGHRNPATMMYEGKEWRSENVKVGAFHLPSMLTAKIHKYEELVVPPSVVSQVPAKFREEAHVQDGKLYLGFDPKTPEIGDMRVSFKVVKSDIPVSLVAQQTGATLTSYQIPDGDALALLSLGTKTSQEMFTSAMEANVMMTWILRLAGIIMMFAGLMMVFKPLVTIADVVPLFGDMLQLGLGLFCGILAFTLSFFTISAAWLFYRPLIGVPLLAVAVAGLVALVVMGRKKAQTRTGRTGLVTA